MIGKQLGSIKHVNGGSGVDTGEEEDEAEDKVIDDTEVGVGVGVAMELELGVGIGAGLELQVFWYTTESSKEERM